MLLWIGRGDDQSFPSMFYEDISSDLNGKEPLKSGMYGRGDSRLSASSSYIHTRWPRVGYNRLSRR